MARILFMTDPHGRANNPISRKDNYPETVLRKIEWVVNKANELDANIICGGDWVNRPDTAPSFIASLGVILAKAKRQIYTIIGNHDVYGYNSATFDRTPLSILVNLGIIKRLSSTATEVGDVYLYGVDASADLDKPETRNLYIKPDDDSCSEYIRILVVHGFLCEREWPHVLCTTIDQIKNTEYDLILSGHEHKGFGIIELPRYRLMCNPGSLLRVSAGSGDVSQDVKVAFFETEHGSFKRKELILLPPDIALPASEVIDTERLIEEKAHEQQISSFMGNLRTFDNNGATFDTMKAFEDFAQQENLPQDVHDLVKDRLTKAAENITIRED